MAMALRKYIIFFYTNLHISESLLRIAMPRRRLQNLGENARSTNERKVQKEASVPIPNSQMPEGKRPKCQTRTRNPFVPVCLIHTFSRLIES